MTSREFHELFEEKPQPGKKLGPEWVYHNVPSHDLETIASEGLQGGSFTHNPGFDFGRDAWIAVRKADLRSPSEHDYGGTVAIEPLWGPGNGRSATGEPERVEGFHVIPAERVAVVDKRGRFIRWLRP